MKENSKKVLTIISIIIVILLFTFMVKHTITKYYMNKSGSLNVSVAKPICNLIIENENFTISNKETNSLYFTVNNFDETNKASDVGMKYSVTITFPEKFLTSDTLNYKLYKVNNDSEEEATITNTRHGIKTVDSTFIANSKKSQKFRLEIIYNSNALHASEITEADIQDFNILINLNSKQVEPERS